MDSLAHSVELPHGLVLYLIVGAVVVVSGLPMASLLVPAEPILMIGNPGLGKSHVAAGLALAACRQGRRVRFYNVATLVNDLIAAQHELKLSRLLTTLGKQELLVLDEFGFIPFSREGANLLFQLCSALYERVAVIITSNLKLGEWKSVLGEEHLTAALLDRLTHRAHILEFLGESFRFRQRLQQAERQGVPTEISLPALTPTAPVPSSG